MEATEYQDLQRRGVLNLGTVVSSDRVDELKALLDRTFDLPLAPWIEYRTWAESRQYLPVLFGGPHRESVLVDFLGKSARVDEICSSIFHQATMRELLKCAVGPDYRPCYMQIRTSFGGSSALPMHRDRRGEFIVSVLLDDTPDEFGTTVFLPGSHRFIPVSRKLRFSDWLVRPWLVAATGVAGTAYMFDGRTWHGRPQLNSGRRSAMIIGFVPGSNMRQSRELPRRVLDCF